MEANLRLSSIMATVILLTGTVLAISQPVSYQGPLTDNAGTPAYGVINVQFRLVSDSTVVYDGGTVAVIVTDGLFNINLGGPPMPALDGSIFDQPHLRLRITINGETANGSAQPPEI